MKKVIGYILIFILAAFGLFVFAYNIYHAGWAFVLSMGILACIIGLFYLGLHLIGKK